MSDLPDSRDDLAALFSAAADGTLNESDEERLAARLQSDPRARGQYYDHVMLAALLRREGRRAAAQEENRDQPSRSESAPRLEHPFAEEPVATLPGRLRPWLLVLAATVLLCLLLSVSEATGVTRLVPTIIRIATGEGSLVIEVDDPSISVTLDGADVTITGAGIHELRLRPGTHKFVATKDGQPVREERVTIEHGGRRIVKVLRQPLVSSVPSESRPQEGAPFRAAEAPQPGEPQNSVASGRRPRVLMVVPSRDFTYAEVDPVRNQLAMHGVAWHIASTSLGDCRPQIAGAAPILRPVKPDLLLADADLADYDAIYFCGGKGCREYSGPGEHSAEAQGLIDEALSANRTVAAMSHGVTILAEAKVLPGRRVAVYPWDDDLGVVADRLRARGAICIDEPVVEDGQFLTGREPRDVQAFIRALLTRLGIEPRPPPPPTKAVSP